MKLRHVLSSLLLALFLGGALAPAASAQYPPTTGNGRVNRTVVGPGGCVTFTGSGFAPGATVTVTDNGTTVATTTASSTGTFSVTVCPDVLGVHILRGTGANPAGGQNTVTARVVVVQASKLPRTGADYVVPAVLLGGALVLVGVGAVFFARRRTARA